MRSASDILRTHNFLESQEKKFKYVKYEFQDYAFRLANDLGDTGNKMIYLRLAKSVDRTLMEQAASFALGYFNEINKGKIFMWKLKQLQDVSRNKRKLTNFDYHFILEEMNAVLSSLAPSLINKWQREWTEQYLPMLKTLIMAYQATQSTRAAGKPRGKAKALFYTTRAGLDLEMFSPLDLKIIGVELVDAFAKQAGAAKAAKAHKIVRKPDPLALAAPDNGAELIWVPHFWDLVPLENESKTLSLWAQKSRPGGLLGLVISTGDTESQTWKELAVGEQMILYYTKQNVLENITPKLAAMGWQVLEIVAHGPKTLLIAQLLPRS